jgi:hypothetical protein
MKTIMATVIFYKSILLMFYETALPNLAHRKPVWIRVLWINDKLVDGSNPRRTSNSGDNSFVWANSRLFDKPACEERAKDALMEKILVKTELAFGI